MNTMNTMNINIMMQHEFNSSWASSLPSHDRAPEPTDRRILHPKKGQIGIVFFGPIVNFKVGSLSLNRFFEEHIPRWNIITMINWMSSKKPFEKPFSTTMDEPESDTREWHKRVTLERNPQSEACEGHQIVVKLVSEWHKRVKKENDTTRGDSRGHSENMLERTHIRWMCYI